MAEVLPPTYTTMEKPQDSIGSELYPRAARTSAPAPNPNFSFPSLPPAETLKDSDFPEPEGAPSRGYGHRSRPSNIAIAPLPQFGFPESTSSRTPTTLGSAEPSPTRSTAMRSGGHRREGSQFIGGDGTMTGPGLMSTSPTKGDGFLPSPPTSGRRRGHAHRRSNAGSQHDLSAMLGLVSGSAPNTPADPNRHMSLRPSLDHSASLPTLGAHDDMPITPGAESPLDESSSVSGEPASPEKYPRASSVSTQPSPTSKPKPRVGFSDNVEYISRPLSTISSHASEDSDTNTIRPSHSVTGSINSLLSYNNPSPPPAKKQQAHEDVFKDYLNLGPHPKVSPETLGPTYGFHDKDAGRPSSADAGLLLRNAQLDTEPSDGMVCYPVNQDFSTPLASPQYQSDVRRLRHFSEGHVDVNERPRSSPEASSEKKQKKVKGWAGSFLSRKSKTKSKEELEQSADPKDQLWARAKDGSLLSDRPHVGSSESIEVNDGSKDAAVPSLNVEEFASIDGIDLDDINFDEDTTCVIRSPDYTPHPLLSARSAPAITLSSLSDNDLSGVLDLDAFSASLDLTKESTNTKRRTMHSSGNTGSFAGPGLHYHRRSESAPALTPVTGMLSSSRSNGTRQMADVFEEDEEDEAGKDLKPKQRHSNRSSVEEREKLGLGVKIIDSDESLSATAAQRSSRRHPADLNIEKTEASLETPFVATSPASPQDSFDSTDVPVDVVDSVDEPRFSVVTKSSDGSTTTPTPQETYRPSTVSIPSALDFAQSPPYLDTPTFNSPDLSPGPQQTSFDAPRLHTATSSITDRSAWSVSRGNDYAGGPLNSTEDVPSLTSSASTMISGQPQMSPGLPHASRPSGERSPSFTGAIPRTTRPTSAGGKRSSWASLLKSTNAHGKSKLSVATFAQEDEPKPEKKKRHRLSKLKFWRSKEKLRDEAMSESPNT